VFLSSVGDIFDNVVPLVHINIWLLANRTKKTSEL
jgi:hypothetical protein